MRARSWMTGLAALATLGLLGGCVSIPTGGGVTTTQVDVTDSDNPLPSLPDLPAEDAPPEEIISEFLKAGRGPQDNYKVARAYLTDDFTTTWIPGARTLITSSEVLPVALADNTWSVTVTSSASVDNHGRYQAVDPGETFDLTFGVVQDDNGQWRINSAPDGTVLPPNRFAAIFDPYELYFFDPSFDYLVPDLRWFRSGSTAGRSVVNALLAGPSDRLGNGSLFSAFPEGTELDQDPTISAGVATVALSSEVSSATTSVQRRMQQQLLQTLRSIASVREVHITVKDFTLQIPDGGSQPDSTYLVGSDPIGEADGRFGVLSDQGVTALDGIGKTADALGAEGGSIVSNDRTTVAFLTGAGVVRVSVGADPVLIDPRGGLVVPSLDPLGYTWSVPAAHPEQLQAIAPDGTVFAVPGLTGDATVVSLNVSRDGARLLVGLSTAGGPRLVVAGVQRNADLAPTALITPLDLPVGSSAIRDAAWVDGVTVVVLSGAGALTSIDSYDIGGQQAGLGAVSGGVEIVGGNSIDGTRVRTSEGAVLRPGSGTSWQDTGIVASFLVSQQ
jgi:hypothetical protein